MKSLWKTILLALTLVALLAGDLQARQFGGPSTQRVDASYRRRTEIDGNNVRTSVFNFCFSGRTGAGQGIPYEWPKNTGRVYIALVAVFVGGEVTLDDGTTARIVDLPAYRQSPAGKSWNLEPIPGYFNTSVNKIAKSDEPDTWPSLWPNKLTDAVDPGWKGSWSGYFGKNQFNADQEMYYVNGDDNYDRWNYTPDTTDRKRKGLGLIIDSRVLEWSQVSVADAVFFIHDIKNDGTKNIKKTGLTIWLADFVGGDGDSQDDSPDFDLRRAMAFSLDADGISSYPPFQGNFVGGAATLYLETPGNAIDRLDNDGDAAEQGSPVVTKEMIVGELSGDGIDNNHNGLIDEDSTHIAFGTQKAVAFADGIDNNDNSELGGPIVTQKMVDEAALDQYTDPVTGKKYQWHRWPPNPESDPVQRGLDGNPIIHLISVGPEDIGHRYKDNIDNDGNSTGDWPKVTQAIIDEAAKDKYHRYRVPGTNVILYDVGPEDLGKKYLNKDGRRDPGIDEGIDEMIDEARDDGIDNNGDWNPLTDDVGLDGAPNTHDFGEGDGKPTSGYQPWGPNGEMIDTGLPGEPHIDKTDINEADQIGLTNVQYLAAGAINFSTTADIFFWANFMIPGSFVDPSLIGTGDYDLFVSSGLFPLRAGQIERISYAVVFGNASRAGNARISGAYDDAIRKGQFARLAYSQNYQFAQAPLEPTVTAVAGNKKVTLYWNDVAEKSVDRFLQGIPGAPAKDFEGYRIYRATDPAFEDARIVTDAFGNPAPYLKPVAQYDLKDGIKGFHPIAFNGVQFYLGDDTGLVHTWTDTTVQNGQKYYYAVRAYDQGYAPLQIAPSESNLKINFDNLTGKIKSIGTSVAIVVPQAPVAGYVPASLSSAKLVTGSTTGSVGFTIVDQTKIKDNHTYRITFQDTTISGGADKPDTFKTKNFTLADVTNSSKFDTLISKSPNLTDGYEHPLTDGFRLVLQNEKTFGVNPTLSHWSRSRIMPYKFEQWKGGILSGVQKPSDYKVIFGPLGTDTSTSTSVRATFFGPDPPLPKKPVNFKVINTSENKQVRFAFWELDNNGGPGIFSANVDEQDIIIMLEKDSKDSLVMTWSFSVRFDTTGGKTQPQPGDTATIVLSKIFRSTDVFEFTTQAQKVDAERATTDLDKIRVVPNPYVATATWEERNSFNTGRGPRSIHFTHLPQVCTIRIYSISGELVATIDHNSTLLDGSSEWNLLTRDGLPASYGVYIYHLDAPGIGEKVGKFALIK